MKKIKRALSLLMVCAMLTPIISGCGTETKKVSEADGKISISVGLWPDKDTDPNGYERLENTRKAFMEKYPDINIVPDTWKFDIQTFMPKAEAGTLPTIYRAFFTEASKIMEFGYAADITDAIKENGYYDKINDYLYSNISQNDRVYLLPYEMYSLGLLINMNLFREAGLIDENDEPMIPKTFEELRETAKIIHDKTGKAGFVFPTAENGGGWNFMPLAWSYGTTFMEQQDGKWVSTFNSQSCTNALKLLRDMKWEDNSLPANTKVNNEEVVKLIGTDQAAMSFANPIQLNGLVNNYGMDRDAIAFAQMPEGTEKHVTLMGGSFYVIEPNATKEQIDAALKWIAFTGFSPDIDDEGKERYRANMESKREQGADVIGIFDITVWNEKATSQKFRNEVIEEFRNIPEKHVKSYNNKENIEFQAEEPMCAQDLYSVLDRCIQEVLTNKNADCAAVLETANSDFQNNFLDYEN